MLLRLWLFIGAFLLSQTPLIGSAQTPAENPAVASKTLNQILGAFEFLSQQGREFHLTRYSRRASTNSTNTKSIRVLIQGGLHGNERLSPEFVSWLARRIANEESPINALAIDELQLDFLPIANPDGVASNTRSNARGVNLNRNFSVLWGLSRENPGPSSFSEPETRAIRALMIQQKYDVAIDVHGYVDWIVAPSASTFENVANENLTNLYRRWINAIRREINVLPNYQLKTALQLNDGGSFEDWSFWQNKTLSLCLELKTERRFDEAIAGRPTTYGDLFIRYEQFIYRMLVQAVAIKHPTT